MTHTEETIYGTTFAHALEEVRRQAAVAGWEPGEYAHTFAANRAHKAVKTFREAFKTLVDTRGEEHPITQAYMEAARLVVEDGDFPPGGSL